MFGANRSTPISHPAMIEFTTADADGTTVGNALFNAIASGNTAAVKQILERPGIDLSQVNDDGQTPLHVAARLGDAESIDALIRYDNEGKAVLRCDSDEWQVRIASAEYCQDPLASSDTDFLDALDREGFTALALTAQGGHLTAMQALLDAGADVNSIVVPIGAARYATKALSLPVRLTDISRRRAQRSNELESGPVNSTYRYTALLLAIKNGHVMAIDRLLAAGAALRSPKHCPYQPLQIAVMTGQVSAAKLLIAHGTPVDEWLNTVKETALTLAATYNQVAMVRALIDANADVHHKTSISDTALTTAAGKGHVEVIKELVINGKASIEGRAGIPLRTPLGLAARWGHAEAITVLLDLGARIDTTDGRRNSPLVLAVKYGHTAAVTTLLERGALDGLTPEEGQRLLVYAVKYDSAELFKALREANVDIDVPDTAGVTPIMIVTKKNHAGGVKMLLNEGANIEGKDQRHYTPMMIAAANNRVEIIHILHAKHAQLEVRAVHRLSNTLPDANSPLLLGKTALLIATASGHAAAVAALLEIGADIDARDNYGSTALTLATEQGRADIISILIEHGANLELRSADKLTPFMIATGRKDIAIMQQLHAAGANVNATHPGRTTLVLKAVQENDMPLVKTLIDMQADVNLPNASGFSPLRVSIENNELHMVELLIDSGADVNAGDDNQITPFMVANRLNRVDMMLTLIDAGADIHAKSINGHDARTFAMGAKAREAQDLLFGALGLPVGMPVVPNERSTMSGQ